MLGLRENRKVTFFLPTLEGGGAERVFINLAEGVLQAGYKVDIVLARAQGRYLQDVPQGVRVVDFKAHTMRRSLLPFLRYVQQERPQAIISGMIIPNIFASLAGVIFRPAIIQTIHNQYSREKCLNEFKPLEGFLFEHSIRWVDRVVAVSKGVAEDFITSTGCPLHKVKVIYNPVIGPEMKRLAEEEIEHTWLNSEEPVFLSVGRLAPQKNHKLLLRAFAKINQTMPCHLILLGEGALLDELKNMAVQLGISEKVDFYGFSPNPYAFMKRSNALVLSSNFEGFGNVLAESMACGCPVISTDCPSGPAEILAGGKYGHLTPMNDEEALAKAMLAVIHGDRRLAPDEWLQRFEMKTICRQYISLFDPEV